MEFKLDNFHRNVSDKELLNDLKRVAHILNTDTLTMEEYNEYGEFHSTTLTRRFGSWFICLEKSGLQPSRSKIGISDDELYSEIENVWISLGKQPSYTQMNELGKYSIGTYEKRFGGWRLALEAFVNYINDEKNDTLGIDRVRGTNERLHQTQRKINLRLRFKVLARDNFKCVACGKSPAIDGEVKLEVDHVIPWSKGGETVFENLQTLCRECNAGKSNLIL